MRILVVAGGYVQAGVSRVLSLLVNEWERQGHDVDIFFFKPVKKRPYPLAGNIVKNGVFWPGCKLARNWSIKSYLKREGLQYDRIIGFSEDANVPLAKASAEMKLASRVVLSVHNPVQKLSPKQRARVRKYYNKVGKVLCVSKGVVQGLMEIGISSEKLIFRPNPIDLSMIEQQIWSSSVDIRELDDSVFNFVGMGRLHTHKGFDILIRAFARVHAENPKSALWILGEGEGKSDLSALAQELKVQKQVHFLGQVDNPFSVIAKMDVFVLSSRLEGWPLALMEAMAINMPVIAFDCPNGPNEIIENETQGILVPCQNENKLVSAMSRVLGMTSTQRAKIGESARQRIENFKVEDVAKRWLDD